jgi:molybdate transport system ATP-binding protein
VARIELEIGVPRRRFRVELSLALDRGTTALAGPSGAGKTTVLLAVAGLLRPETGRIVAGGEVWFDARTGTHLPPERRSVGWVPQDHGLFPHMTVAENVAFGARGRATDLLDRLGVAHLAGDRPHRLSGGERQRVALARALAREPEVLLLDEPLASLDADTRAHVREELAATLAQLDVPTLLVTHDAGDAAALADRVAVVVDGEVRQLGTPQELTTAPADPFVVAFTGGSVLEHEGRRIALQPWQVRVQAAPPPAGRAGLQGTVTSWLPEGDRVRARVAGVLGEAVEPLGRGASAWATWDPADAVALPAASQPRGR